jgi:hypothetical protein
MHTYAVGTQACGECFSRSSQSVTRNLNSKGVVTLADLVISIANITKADVVPKDHHDVRAAACIAVCSSEDDRQGSQG